jgi:hypothetical protein
MAYQEWGLGPPHFDGKNYQMWQRRMSAFLHGKGHIPWDVTKNTTYVQSINFLAQDREICTTSTTRKSITYFVLFANLNPNVFVQRTWLVGYGTS